MRVRSVRIHDEEVSRAARKRDLPPVGRPGRMRVVLLRRRQPRRPRSVGVHHVDVERPAALARERDSTRVGRPCRLDLEEQASRRRRIALFVGQPYLPLAVRVQRVDRVVAIPRADDEEVRPWGGVPATAGTEGERDRRAESAGEQESPTLTPGPLARPRGTCAASRDRATTRRRSSRSRSRRRP